jgi:anti-sigma factor RsiW
MAFTPKTDEEAAQAITRLVDGTLSDGERGSVEAWAQASPEITRQVAAERSVARALATAGPAVPDRLIDAVQARSRATRRAPQRSSSARGRVPAGRTLGWRPAAALGAMAAVALAVVIAVGSGGSGPSPSITAAAKLAFTPATQPAPSVADAQFLDVSYGGVTFPNYARLSTVATGQLANRIGGRPALTVYYRLRDGTRLSYTVFSGQPVPLPAAARIVRYDGVPLRAYRTSDGLSVVTLVRSGRTCVLAASTTEDAVLNLAAEPVLAQRT